MHISIKNEAIQSIGYGMLITNAKHSIAANTANFQCLHAKSPKLYHANLPHRKTNLDRILYFRIWVSKKFLYTIDIMIIVYIWCLYWVLQTFQPTLVFLCHFSHMRVTPCHSAKIRIKCSRWFIHKYCSQLHFISK